MNTGARREELYELLPWLENGTLDGDEREAVRALLASDLDANRQVRELRVLHAAVADEPIMATNMAMNLRRLYARLDPPRPQRPRWFLPLGWAAAALLMLAGGLGLFMAGERAGRFHTLSNPATLPATPADVVLYRVDVDSGVDATQLAALTGNSAARVLQGPSERGVALLSVPAADADRVLATLRADSRLRFVTAVPR